MIWSDFVLAVGEHLVTDATRRGIEVFRVRQIRNAVIDLQRFVPGFREGNQTTYQVANATAVGCAHLLDMPAGARPKSLYMVDTAANVNQDRCRHRLDFYPWLRKHELVDGRLNYGGWLGGLWAGTVPPVPPQVGWGVSGGWLTSKGYCYTVGPHARNFLVYPQMTATSQLELFWDGIKTAYNDGDTVPFNDQCAEAAAYWVKAKIGAYVNNDSTLMQMAWADYVRARRLLYTDWKSTQRIEGKGDEYNATEVAPV